MLGVPGGWVGGWGDRVGWKVGWVGGWEASLTDLQSFKVVLVVMRRILLAFGALWVGR